MLVACADGAGPSGTSGPSLAIEVAPLDLPGVGFACYDLAVENGLGQPVWSRGNPALAFPGDTATLCSTAFGNGPGGDITYIGPCDASQPNHEVALVLDGLYATGGAALTDFENPCPSDDPCLLPAVCQPNGDTPVNFNLTVLRDARQGFFDVAVNFDDIFCSAKADCTYDDAGQEPITLLFDPATQTRTQTAVIGLACTAGPGNDVSTTLLMNDVRVTCQTSEAPEVSAFVTSCDDLSTMVIGHHEVVTSSGRSVQAIDWTRDSEGRYVPALAAVNAFPAQFGTTGVPLTIIGQTAAPDPVTTALGVTQTPGPNGPTRVQPAIFQRQNLGAWSLAGIVELHADSPTPIAWPIPSPVGDDLVTRNLQGAGNNPFVTYAQRLSTTTFAAPLHLRRPADHGGACSDEVAIGQSYAMMSCENTSTSQWDLLVWDLTATPNTPGGANGPGLTALVLPLTPASFSFTGGVTATGILGHARFGAILGNIATNDRFFSEVRLQLSNNTTTSHLVAWQRGGGYAVAHPPIPGLDQLPTTVANTWDPRSATSLSWTLAIESNPNLVQGSPQDAVVGVGTFSNVVRPFVARYDRPNNAWSVHNDFESAPGVDLFDVTLSASMLTTNATHYVAGAGATVEDGPRSPFIAAYQAGGGVVTFLPIPTGWTLGGVDGVRGNTRLNAPTRRLSGWVVSPDGERFAIEWRFAVSGGALTLSSWGVFSPSTPIPDASADELLIRRAQSGEAFSPRFAGLADRCAAFIDDTTNGALVVDPVLDQTPDLSAVVSNTTVTPTTGALSGVRLVRDPVVGTASLVEAPTQTTWLIDPSQGQGGNVWSDTNPKPANAPAFIRQLASFFGREAITCDNAPCNKLYWNTAIAFDPTAKDCTLSFEATAAQTSSLVSGQLPVNATWPVLVGRVQLTTAPANGPASLACRRHPLGGGELETVYKPQGTAFPFCHALGPSAAPVASELACGYSAATYESLEDLLEEGF